MTQEQKIEFVNQNINLVPKVMKSRFDKMDIDKQVVRIKNYIEVNKLKEQAVMFTKIAYRVKQLFEARKASIADANAVIKYCNEYITSCKEKELAHIDEEIQRLTELKEKLQANK